MNIVGFVPCEFYGSEQRVFGVYNQICANYYTNARVSKRLPHVPSLLLPLLSLRL